MNFGYYDLHYLDDLNIGYQNSLLIKIKVELRLFYMSVFSKEYKDWISVVRIHFVTSVARCSRTRGLNVAP